MAIDWQIAFGVLTTAFLVALVVLLLAERAAGWLRGPATAEAVLMAGDTVFLFDGERLLDATPRARQLLSRAPDNLPDWQRLASLLAPRFPGFPDRAEALAIFGQTTLAEHQGAARLHALWNSGLARIALEDGTPADGFDDSCVTALNAELATLQQVVAQMPDPAWQEDAQGRVTWANQAYLALVATVLGEARPDPLTWPLPQIFPNRAETRGARQSVTLPDGEEAWFTCQDGAGPHGFRYAAPADAAQQAETALRSFVQTLTKTFADLPTGLAVFDRDRKLVLFNPALVDLCFLEPAFLSARPSLNAFLDRLREKHMIPEPKNYKTWREQMTSLEQEATRGAYAETWTLPSGQTFRVSGRPHPDGAMALLFQDASSEMSLTRRFRAELDLGQAVLDSFDEAVAVFSPAGVLVLSNAAYVALWGSDPSETLGEIGIHDATRLWEEMAGPTPFWQAAARVISGQDGPAAEGQLTLPDGRSLACRANRIGGGGTILGFRARASGAGAPARPVAPAGLTQPQG